jgi:hypothetical protein
LIVIARLVPATHQRLMAPKSVRNRRCVFFDAEIMGGRDKRAMTNYNKIKGLV